MRVTLALLLALVSTQALAAGRVWISEFAAGRVEAAAPFAPLPAVTKQTLSIASVNAVPSAPFGKSTKYIRIICETQCAVTGTGVATTNDTLLPALRPEYFGVVPGSTISVIAAP